MQRMHNAANVVRVPDKYRFAGCKSKQELEAEARLKVRIGAVLF
jgi:hypothetical protein